MKPIKLIRLLILGLVLSSCAHRVKILNANAVSMTKYHLEKGQKVKILDEVEGKFCIDQYKQSGTIGLMDEAIKDAQTKSNSDFISKATFYTEGTKCIVVVGAPYKIVKK